VAQQPAAQGKDHGVLRVERLRPRQVEKRRKVGQATVVIAQQEMDLGPAEIDRAKRRVLLRHQVEVPQRLLRLAPLQVQLAAVVGRLDQPPLLGRSEDEGEVGCGPVILPLQPGQEPAVQQRRAEVGLQGDGAFQVGFPLREAPGEA
jgi:hypothetical protein